ncbi:class I SAM-dependent methyltransferase [Reichenbachiella sp. MALMAid0571]|uniref:class I SAM-dependent methyltransferase n=1 Tax=Reichenbachiella sp. MALMAid0571 TaxID=3143939 RepID=UPI0032DEF7F6
MGNPLELLKKIDSNPLIITKNYKTGKKRGLDYMVWRVQRPLIKFYNKVYQSFNPGLPWLCITAIEFFKKYLTDEMIGVEFGSGRSTHFFCERSKFVVSIEHHETWYHMVKQKLEKEGIDNVDYRFVPANSESEEMELPAFYKEWNLKTKDFEYRKMYNNYFNVLKDFENGYFDYILIDGRARPECLFTSMKHLKSGGLMILDNSERERYSIVFDKLSEWKSYTCTSGSTDTTFWVKP